MRHEDWAGEDPDEALHDRTVPLPLPPGTRHHAAVATLASDPDSAVAAVMGDGLVRRPSAAFAPNGTHDSLVVIGDAGHNDLLDHPRVAELLASGRPGRVTRTRHMRQSASRAPQPASRIAARPPPPHPAGGPMSDFVPGLEGVIAFETEIAEPDKEGSALRYRGVDIEDLVGRVSFGSVWSLLVNNNFNEGPRPAEQYPFRCTPGTCG